MGTLQGRFSYTIPVIALMPPETGIRFWVSASQILNKRKKDIIEGASCPTNIWGIFGDSTLT